MIRYLDRSGREIPEERWKALIRNPGAMLLRTTRSAALEAEAFCVGVVTDLEVAYGLPARPYGVKLTPLLTDKRGNVLKAKDGKGAVQASYRFFPTAAEALGYADAALARDRQD